MDSITTAPSNAEHFILGRVVVIKTRAYYDSIEYMECKYKKASKKRRIRNKWVNRFKHLNEYREVEAIAEDCTIVLRKC